MLASKVQSLSPFPLTSWHLSPPRAAPVTVKRATGGGIVTRRMALSAAVFAWRAVICTSVETATVVVSIVNVPVVEPDGIVIELTVGRAVSRSDVERSSVTPPLTMRSCTPSAAAIIVSRISTELRSSCIRPASIVARSRILLIKANSVLVETVM